MPRTEEGEFELVMGNKQLLSVFFIIAILLGAAFTAGYILGRNSTPVSASSARDVTGSSTAQRPESMPVQKPEPLQTASGGEAAAAAETSRPEEKPLEVPAVGGTGQSKVVKPEAGQLYVQVRSMLAMPEADILVEVLSKKGFRAVIAPGPNDDRFRVLVGPVADTVDAARTKADLEQAGFKDAFPKKY